VQRSVITLVLQQDEAAAVEKVLDVILTHDEAANAIFADNAERRSALRASKKLHWCKAHHSHALN
jgi:hypothetical protein